MVADEKLNLLDFNICPADISSEVQSQIDVIAEKFINLPILPDFSPLNYSSIKRKSLVNETAPRLHNSWSSNARRKRQSQFEQFYRVLKNVPLADTDAFGFREC